MPGEIQSAPAAPRLQQRMSYYCACNQDAPINHHAVPILVKVTVAHANGVPLTDVERLALHPALVAIERNALKQELWCAQCAPKALAALFADPDAKWVAPVAPETPEAPETPVAVAPEASHG